MIPPFVHNLYVTRRVKENASGQHAPLFQGGRRDGLFEALRPALEDPDSLRPLAQIADELGTSEGAVRTASWRLRQAYGEFLRAEVSHTLSDPADVDDELSHLLLILSS